MTYILDRNWLIDVGKGLIPGHSILHKFGYGSVGTSLTPVTSSLTYQTPTTATALEILSSDANDTAAGTGARTVTVEGLDGSGNPLTETVSMNGTAAVALSNSFLVYLQCMLLPLELTLQRVHHRTQGQSRSVGVVVVLHGR